MLNLEFIVDDLNPASPRIERIYKRLSILFDGVNRPAI